MIKQPNMRSTNSGLPMDVTTFSFAFDSDKRTAFFTLNCYTEDTEENNRKQRKPQRALELVNEACVFLSCHMPIDD